MYYVLCTVCYACNVLYTICNVQCTTTNLMRGGGHVGFPKGLSQRILSQQTCLSFLLLLLLFLRQQCLSCCSCAKAMFAFLLRCTESLAIPAIAAAVPETSPSEYIAAGSERDDRASPALQDIDRHRGTIRGNRLSDTTCLARALCRSGE